MNLTNKKVIAFNDFIAQVFKAIVGTVSGTSISFGTEVTFESSAYGDSPWYYFTILRQEKLIFEYQDTTNSDTGTTLL